MKDLIALSTEITRFDADEFARPDNCFQPTYTWIWNAPIDREGIRTRLNEMAAAGIRGTYILPEPPQFRPTSMKTFLAPPYLSYEFMELVRYALEYALSLDMVVWMYDEGGWPSGSACGQVARMDPSLRRKRVFTRDIALRAGDTYQMGDQALAGFDADGLRVRDGALAQTDTCITEYFVDYEDAYNGYGVDPFEEGLGETFVRSTHERYAQ